MPKCDQCNRAELPTKEFVAGGKRRTRRCGNCEAKAKAAHGEDYLQFVKGSADDGIRKAQSPPGDQEAPPVAPSTERQQASAKSSAAASAS